MDYSKLIKAIEDYAALTGLKPSTICQHAVQNRNVYARITGGRDVKADTVDRVLAWIEADTRKPSKRKAAK